MKIPSLLFVILVMGCDRSPPTASQPRSPAPSSASEPTATAARNALPPAEPIAPGRPGGLPDDRSPVSEAPFLPTSAQGAADVVQTYYALIGEGRYSQARSLWSDGGRASGQNDAEFASQFKAYDSYRGLVGAPGEIEGAVGSLYVEVPVQVAARRRDGAAAHLIGQATLRRINDVPGSSAQSRQWRIAAIALAAAPSSPEK